MLLLFMLKRWLHDHPGNHLASTYHLSAHSVAADIVVTTVHSAPVVCPGVLCCAPWSLVCATRVRTHVACSAITLGRIAWMCPEPIAPHLEHFTAPWCNALRTVRDDVEKEHAFLGLAALLRLNAAVSTRAHAFSTPACSPSKLCACMHGSTRTRTCMCMCMCSVSHTRTHARKSPGERGEPPHNDPMVRHYECFRS